MAHILIVDDDDAFRAMLKESLDTSGFETTVARNKDEALAHCRDIEPGLVLLDMKMDGDERAGLHVLSELKRMFPALPVVMMTAFGEVQSAVAAMKAGAFDFLEKPLSIAEVREVAASLLAESDTSSSSLPNERTVPFGGIVPKDPEMRQVLSLLHAAAESDSPVLIQGESGTGKELAATFLHEHSARKDGPFVKVNCSAIPEGLVETEMFGATAGAYTGATRPREGRFRAAEKGTLFLDEIGEMNIGAQAKLLRVLQEREYEPVGSMKPLKANVRVIAASNRPIREAIRLGRFREDLYYRLNIFEIELPPLRKRRGDILPLARLLLASAEGERPRRLSEEVEAILLSHSWPGNIRELSNVMERARILARGGLIRMEHLPPDIASCEPPPDESVVSSVISVHDMEVKLISRALEETEGNRTEAAKRLGMSRRALLYKIKRFGIDG